MSGLYGIESSPLYDIQLELKNNRPIFVAQAGIVLDKNNYINEKPKDILVDMGVVDDMFFDSDINDKLQYSSTVPEKLKDLVSIFKHFVMIRLFRGFRLPGRNSLGCVYIYSFSGRFITLLLLSFGILLTGVFKSSNL